MTVKISIIVPVYNVERELPRCVDSLIAQTYKDLEIILVDDGSMDNCSELCDSYALADNRVRVVHKKNGGLSDARNEGRRVARGDYILYVDSDDWLESKACEKLACVAESTGAELVAFEGVQETLNEFIPMKRGGFEDGKLYTTKEFVLRSIAMREWYAPAWLYMYSARMFIRAASSGDGLYYKRGILHEDMEMQPRLFSMVNNVAYCAGVFYHYVERQGSIMTSKWTQRRLGDIRSIFEGWKQIYESVDDMLYRRVLLGHLSKCYLYACRVSGRPDELQIRGIDWRYLFKFGLDIKEKIKALIFGVSPALFVRVGQLFK